LNVVVLRSLSGESIAFPASKCLKCQTTLKWWHNIPVISYICLKAKCAFCKEPISIQYPILELVTGIIFVLVYMRYGLSVNTLFALVVSSLLLVIAGTDIREKVVFDRHTYALIALGLLYAVILTVMIPFPGLTKEFIFNNPLTGSFLGIILGVVIMEAVARLGYLVAGTRAFGEGDTYIAAGLGALFGWQALIEILVLSLVIQMVFALPVFMRKLIQNKDWLTLISLSVFFIYVIGFLVLQDRGLLTNMLLYTACVIVLALIGFCACKRILTGLKEKQDELTYLPFGPAMVIAALIALLM
jgi:leader peptidase (prepilin peptidase)/N-methyltransferase